MEQFVVQLVFSIEVLEKPRLLHFEEKTILLKAENQFLAYAQSLQIGRDNEGSFINQDGYQVRWKMLGISSLTQIDQNKPYFELCSILKENYTDYQSGKLKENMFQIQTQFEKHLID